MTTSDRHVEYGLVDPEDFWCTLQWCEEVGYYSDYGGERIGDSSQGSREKPPSGRTKAKGLFSFSRRELDKDIPQSSERERTTVSYLFVVKDLPLSRKIQT
jgi:hypothetical protein